PPVCAATNSGGEYTIAGLAPGGYYVLFNPPLVQIPGGIAFSHSNYIAQAFEGAYTEAAAKLVTVAAGGTVAGVDAALAPGGEVASAVDAALSPAPPEQQPGAGSGSQGGPSGESSGPVGKSTPLGGALLSLRSRLLAVRRGEVKVVLACHSARRCHGTLKLWA